MLKNISTLFALILMFSSSVFGQPNRFVAWHQIDQLKNGVLLVRLQTSQKKIDHLKKSGDTNKADAVKEAQEFENESLIMFFDKHFDFCPVYFFYSPHAVDIRNGNYQELFLANGDKAANLNSENIFFVAVKKAAIDSEFNSSQGRLLTIMDREFKDLVHPFPFYTRFHGYEYFENILYGDTDLRLFEKDVRTFNRNLTDFHRKTAKRRMKKRYRKYFPNE